MIFRTPFFLPWLYPGLQWRRPSNEKILYLTFDDGPIPGPTEFVLHELYKADAKATFFCIGDNVRKHPGIFRSIVEQGHTIGNHTFNHLKGWSFSEKEYLENIQKSQEIYASQGLVKVKLFRPPYGRIRRSQIKALDNFDIIMWDVLTHDYSRNFSPADCLRGSIKASRAGSIVVFHDSQKAEKNLVYSLPRYLDHFGSLGYSFKALSNT